MVAKSDLLYKKYVCEFVKNIKKDGVKKRNDGADTIHISLLIEYFTKINK